MGRGAGAGSYLIRWQHIRHICYLVYGRRGVATLAGREAQQVSASISCMEEEEGHKTNIVC